ncbi:MAG: regulatory protein RecX [Steroidobacteraceae bacterium]
MSFGRRPTRVDESRAANPQAARAAALALVARREYSTAEASAALVRKGYDAGVVAATVVELCEERLLDDTRYAEALVRMLTNRGQGPQRVRHALQEAGIPAESVAAALDTAPDWMLLAADVRRRKFGARVPKDWPGRARQMRFLQYRGFSKDHIASALGYGADGSDSDDINSEDP